MNPNALLAYYGLVNIDKDTFFDNMLSAEYAFSLIDRSDSRFNCRDSESDVYKEWQLLGKQRDLDAWEMTPATVNAYYNPTGNEVCCQRNS
jgi:endothelin-converting enzyme